MEHHRLGGDDVLQGPALDPGEDGPVQGLGVGLPGEHEAAARTAQGLVGAGAAEVGVGYGRGMGTPGDQPRDVGHVRQQQGPHLVRDLPEAGPVEVAGVGGGPDDDHPGPVLPRQAGHLVVVDALRLRVHPVGEEAIELGGEVDRGAVGQVPPGVEVHPQHGVARLEGREVDPHVGGRAGVGLHVGVLGPEQLTGPAAGQLLHLVDPGAALVEAPPGVALGVLGGHHRAGGLQHGGAGVVLGGDELDRLPQASRPPPGSRRRPGGRPRPGSGRP